MGQKNTLKKKCLWDKIEDHLPKQFKMIKTGHLPCCWRLRPTPSRSLVIPGPLLLPVIEAREHHLELKGQIVSISESSPSEAEAELRWTWGGGICLNSMVFFFDLVVGP